MARRYLLWILLALVAVVLLLPLALRSRRLAHEQHELGLAAVRAGNLDQAICHFTEALQHHPDHADTYRQRGLAYYKKRDYDRAIADFTETLRLDEDCAEAFAVRGACYAAKKEYAQALADQNRALEIIKADLAEPDFF